MEDVNVSEFFDAFGGDGNQTDTPEAEEVTTETPETPEEPETEVTEEETKEETSEEAPDEATEGKQEEETFTLKVNKEERSVSRDEMVSLAQKGADYDRIREKLEQGKSDNAALREQLAKAQEVSTVISEIAQAEGVTVEELVEGYQIAQMVKKENIPEAQAREKWGRMKAEKQLEKMSKAPEKTPEQLQQERIDRELAEFRTKYPDVDITALDTEKMASDLQSMTFTEAYQHQRDLANQEEIAQLKAQIKAQEQNAKNRATSPGSTVTSGAKKQKDQFEDFWSAFK